MDKFKKITLYALTAALLATSCPWQAFAERNQPVAPPPVTAAPGNEDSGANNENPIESQNKDNNVKNGKHRYDLDIIGLDKDGKIVLITRRLRSTTKSIWLLSTTGPD